MAIREVSTIVFPYDIDSVCIETEVVTFVRSRTNNSRLLGTVGSSREFWHLITNEEIDILV